jgi:hypothetical protein
MDIEADLIATVEAQMIRLYRPLWNSVISGFGIHAPGGGGSGQAPSEWDTLYPGGVWGSTRELSAIMAKIEQEKTRLPPA